MDELAEGLDGADHAGQGVGTASGGAIDRDHGAGGCPAQLAQ